MTGEVEHIPYVPHSTRYYIRHVELFARHFNCSPDRLGPGHIREYQAYLFTKPKLSPGAVTNHLCAYGKGRQDRDVMLSPVLLDELHAHWRRLRRKSSRLFPGTAGTEVISPWIRKPHAMPASTPLVMPASSSNHETIWAFRKA